MFELTHPQKLIYDMEKFSGGAIAVICGSVLRQGYREIAELTHAVNELFRINSALRTRIVETDGGAMQTVADFVPQDIDVLQFASKADLESYAADYAKQPLDFYGQLCEIKIVLLPDSYGALIKLHHIIGDAWSLSLLATQFCEILDGNTPTAYAYEEYAAAEAEYLQSKRHEKNRAFFLEQFKKCDEVTYLSEKQSDSLVADRKTFVIDVEKSRLITDYAEAHHTSPFVLFMAALSVYMNRTKMNVEKFYIGTAVLNRTGIREKNTVGMFINTVPMLIELNNGQTFAENLSAIGETAFGVFRHQKHNYGDILADIRKEYGFSERLYDVLLSYQNASIGSNGTDSVWYHNGVQTESLQIHIDDRDGEGIFKIQYDYQTEKFTEQEINRLHQHICNLLFDAIKNDSKKLHELNLLTADERQKLLFDFNDTSVAYPRDKCVHTLFEEQAARTPDKTAVIACDRTLTYAELNKQANRIAHGLMEKGIGVGDIVAFALPRKSYLIATMLGILKTGAAYLPIDPDFPRDRIDYMLADSESKFLITDNNIDDFLQDTYCENPLTAVTSSNLCYCIYTSGSTGLPKGTLLTHRNVVNYVNNNSHNVLHRIIKNNYKRIVSVTTVGFDIFVTESLLPLANGMEVLLANENQSKIQSALASLLGAYPVDVIQTTPTKMKSLIINKDQVEYLRNIKAIVLGGEALDSALVDTLKLITDADIYNIYGPTETTVWSTNSMVTKSADITIGNPIANMQVYIVDQYLCLTPIGVTGELCIAGDGVGVGYLNRPELTAEKFIDNPFGDGKLYKTGDLAYWREDGNIVYVGRNDFQVKIRGLRIELGEIESAISAIDGISQAVAVVRKDAQGRQLICAFYSGAEVSAKEIREIIGQKLPKYMLPHIVTHLDELPLTTSGKINRKALPEVDLNDLDRNEEYIKSEGEIEKSLAALMEQVLGYSPVGREDDFFDLGGDSLKAIEFVSKAHNEGIYFALQSIFDHPTVRKLAECIQSGDKQQISYADLDFTEINKILAKNTVEQMKRPQEVPMGNILLAGATGFLGIHILADFLEHDSGIAYCLVRGKDQAESEKRLSELLRFYFGDRYTVDGRVQVLCADLQKDNFGMTEQDYTELFTRIDTVINCAASVKHYGSYRYFYEVNVETVKRLIDFCRAADAKLIHTSTLSVSGNSFADQFDGYVSETEKHFSESTLYIGQPLDNVYARSKFEAEKAVLDAMAQGLKANIMRMGNLTNRLSDGVFQINYESNAAAKRVKSLLELGAVPEYLIDIYAEFTPIDEAAKAVMTIARHFSSDQTVFHINSTKVVYLDRLLEHFHTLGYDMKVVDGAEFTQRLRETARQAGMEHIFETFINDMDENGKLQYDSNIRIENDFTERYLRQLGFEWSEIGLEYLRKYMDYFRKIGFLGGIRNV